jgi:hypothetical protein
MSYSQTVVNPSRILILVLIPQFLPNSNLLSMSLSVCYLRELFRDYSVITRENGRFVRIYQAH